MALLWMEGLVGFAVPAVAAAAGPDSVPPLEEIVVTARKREESLQRVPVSISAISDTTIEALGANKVRDLEYMVPNLVFSGFWDTQSSISVRGVGDFTRNMGYEMRVGVYVDGVFAGRSGSANQELLDIERVEILRGPQGTLFGKNTIAGAISLTTRRPDGDAGGSLSVEYGNFDLFGMKGFVNLPLVDEKLYSKWSVIYRRRDGYVENLFPGQPDAASLEYVVARGQLRAVLGPSTEALLTLDYKDDDHYAYLGEPNAGIGYDTAPRPLQLNTHMTPGNRSRSYGVAVRLDHTLASGATLTSISSYRDTDAVAVWEEDQGPLRLFDLRFGDDDLQVSQEFRLASARDGRFSYVAGLYYFHQKASTDRSAVSGADLIPGVTLTIPQEGATKTDAYAAFAHGEFKLTDALTLNAGLRYTAEDKSFRYTQLGVPLFIDFVDYRDKFSDDDFSPSLGLSYLVDDRNLLYATVSRGYKSGGWNADYVVTTDLRFGSEHATNYELGAKTQWLEDRVRLNVSAFLTKYSDYQVFQFVPVAGGGLIFSLTNAAKATTKGFELEFLARPVDSLTVSATLGYTDATFDRFRNGGGAGVDFDGNRLPLAPRTTLSLGAEYEFRLSDQVSGYLRGDYSHRSSMFHNPNNQAPQFYSSGYGLLDARLALRLDTADLEVALWGHNLTDEVYEVNKWITFLGTSASQFGSPRTYGIEVKWSF